MPMFNGARKPVQTTRAKKNYILSLSKNQIATMPIW